MWKYTGTVRPDFARTTRLGQESVWDYPRPPALKADERTVTVFSNDTLIAKSNACIRVLETAGAPTFYIPCKDVSRQHLINIDQRSHCEWKGTATYCSLRAPRQETGEAMPCGWQYIEPSPAFITIKDYYGFYPGVLDCYVDDEQVRPQPGGFYGGWVTDEIVGPIKGEPGSGNCSVALFPHFASFTAPAKTSAEDMA